MGNATRCIVKFTDAGGIVHSAEVYANSLYDAVVEAYKVFAEYECLPGIGSELEIEQKRPSLFHNIKLKSVVDWAHSTAKNAQERMAKDEAKKYLPRAS